MITTNEIKYRIQKYAPDFAYKLIYFVWLKVILKIFNGDDRNATFISLGLLFALSYLTKAVMFPLTFVFIFIPMALIQGLG